MRGSKLIWLICLYCLMATAICIIFIDLRKLFDVLPNSQSIHQKEFETCGRYPTHEHVKIDNLYWQVLEFPKGYVNIMNAYLDLRQNKSVVRINTNSKKLNDSDVFYCQFWYDEKSPPKICKATEVLLMWTYSTNATEVKYPYLIECPFEGTAPISVSLVTNRCDNAENNVKIIDVQPAGGLKKRFGVCSKRATLENRDFVVRFIEWVHMVRLLGADKVHFPYDNVHPDLYEIIKYFEDKGMVETWRYLNPTGISDSNPRSWQNYQLEVNTQTDCFYRVKNLYDFVVIIDMDELIIPVMPEDMTWEDIIKRANLSEEPDAYISQNVYYPKIGQKPIEEIPKSLYTLQHIERSQNFSNWGCAVKSIFRVQRILSIHTHTPHLCISNEKHQCKRYFLSENISQNSHYRDHMDEGTTFDKYTQEDKTIWKYKDRLIKAFQETLTETKYVP